MPNEGDSNGTHTLNYKDILETFRFKNNKDKPESERPEETKNGIFQEEASPSTNPENFPSNSTMSWHSPEGPIPNGITCIPETPEHLLNHSSNGNHSMQDSEDEHDTQIIFPKSASRMKRNMISDTESDSDVSSQETKRHKTPTDLESPMPVLNNEVEAPVPGTLAAELMAYDLFTDKELGLRMMMSAFPKMDLMVLQDTLSKCDWYAKKAIHVIQDGCDSLLCNHIKKPVPVPESKPELIPELVPVPEPKPENVPDPELKLEPKCEPLPKLASESELQSEVRTDSAVIKTEPVDEDNLKPLNSTDSNLNGLIQNNELKVELISSDESDQEIIIPMKKVVRNRIHQISSDDSDDLGQIKVISMSKINPTPKRTTKAVRQNAHVISSGDEPEIASSEVPDEKSKKKKKRKRKKDLDLVDEDEVDYAGNDLYDSEDSDIDDTLTPARAAVLDFYRNASTAELLTVPGCSKKKMDTILLCRPFENWVDLVRKLQTRKQLSTDMLARARDVIVTRDVMAKLMQRCERIALDMEKVVAQINSGSSKGSCITKQPEILTTSLHLAPYQMLGLNWLWVMHKRHLNGILADEMGLGKTIQAIAFLAYIKQKERPSRHLVIVPSSTLDNWVREFQLWCPSLEIITYYGSQEARREMRLEIINKEVEFDIMMTTYNMVSSCPEDRTLFRRLAFHYVIFDEAHMLKNMNSQRYQNLMKIKADRRLLLTGTPLQNNLVELMSLLIFVMPDMFYDKIDQVKQMFASACKSEENRSLYEKDRIEHAKRIMKPFVLRRLKNEVLKQLPSKNEKIHQCFFTETQKVTYASLVEAFSKRISDEKDYVKSSGMGMMMDLRKAANHPLLIRRKFTDDLLRTMSEKMINEPTHVEASPELIFEDMQVMSDFELHRLCKNFKSISSFKLADDDILDSGKFNALDSILPELIERGSRFLLFSQFTMMLDIVEEYMTLKNYTFVRLDGSTPVPERQALMDRFNGDTNIFAFLLSTRAGGLGINLTAANVVLLHDIDFNPYNDKQAEDRCHRLGQTKEVTVLKMITKDSIEEAILKCAQDKLKLEKDITTDNDDNEEDPKTMGNLLKAALGL